MKVDPNTQTGIVEGGKKQVWRYPKRSVGIFSVFVTLGFAVIGAGIGGVIGAGLVGGGDDGGDAQAHHGGSNAHHGGGAQHGGGAKNADDEGGDRMVKGIVSMLIALIGMGIGIFFSLVFSRNTRLLVLTEDTIRTDEDDDSHCCWCIPCRHSKDATQHSIRDLMWWAGQQGPPAALVKYVELAPIIALVLLGLGILMISEGTEDTGVILVVLSIVVIAFAFFILKCLRTYHLRFGLSPPAGPDYEFKMNNSLSVFDDIDLDILSVGGGSKGNDLSCATDFMRRTVLQHHSPAADHKEEPAVKLYLSQTLPGFSAFAYKVTKIHVFSTYTHFITEKKVWWLPCCGLPLSVEKRTVLHQSVTNMRVFRAGARSVYAVSWLVVVALCMILLLAELGNENIVGALIWLIFGGLCFLRALWYLMDIIYKIHSVKLTYANVIQETFRLTTSDLAKFEEGYVSLVGRVCGSGSQAPENVAKTFPKNRWCCYSEILKDVNSNSNMFLNLLCCCLGRVWNCPAAACVCSDEAFAITTYRFQLTFTQKWLGCMTCGSIQNTFFYNSVTRMSGSHGWRFPACCRCCCQNTCLACFPFLPRSMFGMEQVWGEYFEAGLHSDVWEDIFEIGGKASSKFCHSACHNYSPIGEAVLVGAPSQAGGVVNVTKSDALRAAGSSG